MPTDVGENRVAVRKRLSSGFLFGACSINAPFQCFQGAFLSEHAVAATHGEGSAFTREKVAVDLSGGHHDLTEGFRQLMVGALGVAPEFF